MNVVEKVLELSSLKQPNPVQQKALDAGLLENKNLVVAAPTASGKTLIAEMAALNTMQAGKKVIYITPLRALASEKFEEFKSKYSQLGFRVAISIGDLDSADHWLSGYDLIIVTSEKLDSLLRHGIHWADQIGLVVVDEIHLLNSPDRGPTLEILLTRLRQVANPHILGLSATISNYKELAEWLGAAAVKSDWRPVKLHRGICWNHKLSFSEKEEIELDAEYPALQAIVNDTLEKKKQILIFISTRKGAESTAEQTGKEISKRLSESERAELNKIADKIEHALEHPTKQCARLAKCIRTGTAFHHAGLANPQRKIIEDTFKLGQIKVIAATPTLAAGVNLPAFRVVIRDLKRFSQFHGMSWIPALELEQMSGRAGRPQYDPSGEAILLTKDKAEARFAWDNYIMGGPEKIVSKVGVEPVLRMHVLALVASSVTPTKDDLMEFFSKTFYAHQYKDMSGIGKILDRILKTLSDLKFIEIEDSYLTPTIIGKRVSELYIDPLTAADIIKGLNTFSETKTVKDFAVLQMISRAVELKHGLGIRKKEFNDIDELIVKYEPYLVSAPPQQWDIDYEDFLKSIKLAWMLQSWAEESGEDLILDKFGVTPGELRGRLDLADWLLYSAQELGLLLGHMDLLKDIRKVRVRLQYGIKEELLPLVKLKGIGRVRARILFGSGLKHLSDLRKIPLESLAKIIGPKVASDIKGQLGEEIEGDN